MKVVRASSKFEKSSFNIIRDIPSNIYDDLIKGHFKSFTGTYKLEKYENISEIPAMNDLMTFLNQDVKAPFPKDAKITTQVGIYTRKSATYIEAPLNTCALRILVNLGYKETYHMNPKYELKDEIYDSGLPEKFLHLEANKYCIMGPLDNSKYLIHVDKDPKITIPPKSPLEKEGSTLRPSNYKRITVVFDFNLDAKLLENLKDVGKEFAPKVKAKAGTSQKELNKQIENIQQQVMRDKELKSKLESINRPSEQVVEKTQLEILADNIKAEDKQKLEEMMKEIDS